MKTVVIVLILSICAFAQMSCSRYTSAKAGKALNKAYETYPEQVADSAAKWYPIVPIDTTDKDTLIKAVDSSKEWQARFDSLEKVKQAEKIVMEIDYRDTCKSTPLQYDKGFKTGYAQGRTKGVQECIPDTVLRVRRITLESTAKLAVEKNKTAQAEKGKQTYRTLLFIAIGALIVLLIIFLLGYLSRRKN